MFTRISRWFRRPKNLSGYVYYARLKFPAGIFYKIGYTTKLTLTERLSSGGFGDDKSLDYQLFFTFREDAWDVEQKLLDHFTKQRAFGKYANDPIKPLCGRGQSELFIHDVLGLDNELYTSPSAQSRETLRAESKQAGDGCLFVMLGLALAPFTLGISLFFIAGGVFEILGAPKGRPNLLPAAVRPKHPPSIQALVDSLKSR